MAAPYTCNWPELCLYSLRICESDIEQAPVPSCVRALVRVLTNHYSRQVWSTQSEIVTDKAWRRARRVRCAPLALAFALSAMACILRH